VIKLITDSASQIPTALAARFGVDVVPVVVTVDGVDYREGVDLHADEFWESFAEDGVPDVVTSQPSPGAFAAVYEQAQAEGATEIISVHVGSDHSGTLNSARLGAGAVDIPIHLVDSGTASFGVTCCVWEAASALENGLSGRGAADRARSTAASVGTTFIIQALDFARRGGRLSAHLPDDHDGVMVLGGTGGAIDLLATGHSVDELCDQMVAPFLSEDRPIRAGVSLADDATLVFTEGIEARLRDSSICVDLVRYRVGPSIAAHTGPGTAGGFWYPIAE
jgi:fatty acid-binding protein DegV